MRHVPGSSPGRGASKNAFALRRHFDFIVIILAESGDSKSEIIILIVSRKLLYFH